MNWKPVKDRLAADPGARQLLAVECTGGSNALVRFYVKDGSRWRLVRRGTAYVGKFGPGKLEEGDAKTPLGELRPLRAFGILPDPGSRLPYLRVVPGTIACDEKGPNYNRIIQTGGTEPQAGCGGERMWELSPEYDYGIETDYNADGIWPMGSAIFVHCKGAKTWTGGCIALDKRLMRQILLAADSGLVISVHTLL